MYPPQLGCLQNAIILERVAIHLFYEFTKTASALVFSVQNELGKEIKNFLYAPKVKYYQKRQQKHTM